MDGPLPALPYNLSVEDTFRVYGTDRDRGLRTVDIQQRRDQYGFNLLDDGEKVTWWEILLKQLLNAMVLVSTVRLSFDNEASADTSRFSSSPWLPVSGFKTLSRAESWPLSSA